MSRPNILLIFTDQQRFDALGIMGNQVIQTPNIDRLGEDGVVFDNAMTPCPLCMPARACTVTGTSASRLDCLENVDPNRTFISDSIPHVLRSEGYYCQSIGKMHFSNRPYQEYYGMDSMILSEETRGVRLARNVGDVVYDDYDNFLRAHHMWGWDKPTEIGYNEIKPVENPLPQELHVTSWCGDETVKFLKSDRPKDKPFFLWTSFVKPHAPYDCPSHLADLYDWRNLPDPWTSDTDGTQDNLYINTYRERQEFDLYSIKAKKKALASYYANITFIDEQIGRIMKTLDEENLTDSTLVIFTSDHGDLMGDHDLWYKCFGFEGSMHIPLLVKWPGRIGKRSRSKEIVSLLDLYPTILNAAGVKNIPERPGEDLLPVINGKTTRDFAFSECMFSPNYMCHVRTAEWKYLFYQNGGYEELYSLADDPHELVNLANDAKYHDVLLQLRGKAEQWILEHGSGSQSLDNKGKLRKNAVHLPGSVSHRPFSRMPWDSRYPPVLNDRFRKGVFWNNEESDWSDYIK